MNLVAAEVAKKIVNLVPDHMVGKLLPRDYKVWRDDDSGHCLVKEGEIVDYWIDGLTTHKKIPRS